jgi:hypothetical protein
LSIKLEPGIFDPLYESRRGLRLMNQSESRPQPVWFVLDELASLQKLPQLETAVTENRKSNNPVVIGLQGKAQMETIYGHIAETMLSMLTTKIFLRTSEPRAAEWISRAIGEVEIEHLRESHTSGYSSLQRRSRNYQLERRVELAMLLKSLGYEVERGKSGQPEIKGYSREYLEASSPRSRQIKEHLAEQGVSGARAAQIAAHQTREDKLPFLSHGEMQRHHREMSAQFGNQPEHVVRESRLHRVEETNPERKETVIRSAITYARDRNLEREAVVEERELMRDALNRSMGEASFQDIQNRFEKQVDGGEWIEVAKTGPGRAFTTGEMIG